MTLTEGELLRVARRRAGLTQAQVAALVGRPQNAVARWEASETGAPVQVWREAGLVAPRALSAGEEACILRERAGLTQKAAARLLGWRGSSLRARCRGDAPVSHVHIIRMEQGDVDPGVYLEALRKREDEQRYQTGGEDHG